MWIWITVWCGFLSAWRTSFNISCKASLLSMNSLYLCLSENVVILPTFLKVLLDIGFLFSFFFSPFKHFEYVTPLPLVSIFFWWKVSYWSYWGSLIHDESFFSLSAPMIFPLAFNILTMICLGVDLGSFCRCRLFFTMFWKFSPTISSIFFLLHLPSPLLLVLPSCVCWCT